MAIELNEQCAPGEHDYYPIVEGNQTVGLKCRLCGKQIKELMAVSEIVVTDQGIIGLDTLFGTGDIYHGNHKRKDPRF